MELADLPVGRKNRVEQLPRPHFPQEMGNARKIDMAPPD
jgi:hypothetical protein